jgi:molybdopterin-guanine dinucleotide biosynthesis protein
MLLVNVSGARDSGETTLIRELIMRLNGTGKTSAVIVNQDGTVDFDTDFVNKFQVPVKYIRGG